MSESRVEWPESESASESKREREREREREVGGIAIPAYRSRSIDPQPPHIEK